MSKLVTLNKAKGMELCLFLTYDTRSNQYWRAFVRKSCHV